MANQGDGSYSPSHSTSRKIRLNRGEMWRKRKASEADGSGIPAKRSLAERLGKKVEVDKAPTNATVTPEKAAKSTGDIHVKTLEEIRREKANRQGGTPAQLQAEGQRKTEETRPSQAVCISAFSQAPPLRKRRRSEEGKQNADELPTKRRVQGANNLQRILTPSVAGQVKLEEPVRKVKPLEEIHIKTLEEIKREKALRLQQREESVPAPPAPPAPAPARRRLIRTPKLIAPATEAVTHVECSTSVPEAVCAPPQKRPAAEMCHCAVSATADGTEEPAAETAAVAAAPALPEDTLVTGREVEPPPNSPDLPLGCWAESVIQAEDSSSASAPPEVTAKTQQLCPTGAGKASFAGEDDLEELMLELSGGDLEGEVDLEPEEDVDELLQELSDTPLACCAESVAEAENSSSASASPQTAAKTQQLCSTGAGKAPFSAEDDNEMVMLELSDEDLEGEVDLEPEEDEDELLQELSDTPLGCWAASAAQAEDSSSASASPQTAAKTQQLCSTGAGKASLAGEDDLEELMLELSGGDLEGEVDLEPEEEVDELLQELSDMPLGCWAESVAEAEDSSSTSAPHEVIAKTQQLCSTVAGKAFLAGEDDLEELMLELSEEDLEGEVNLEPEEDEDELLQDLSDTPLECWAESAALAEDSSSTSAPPEVTAKTQQLSCTGAGKARFAGEDDLEELMLELSGGDLEGEVDLEPEEDVDELLQELSDTPLGCWAESVAQAENSSSASASPQTAAKTQQLCSTGAGKAPFSAEDDIEMVMLELSDDDLEGEVDLEPEEDEDELLQELSDTPLGCWAESLTQAEDSSSTSAPPEITAKAQELCSTGAGKAPFAGEDDLEELMLELSDEDLEGEVNLEPEADEDELLQDSLTELRA